MCGSIIKGRTVKLIIQPYAYFSGGGGGGQEMYSPGAGGIGAGGAGGAGGASSNSASGDSNSFYSSTNTGQLGQPILEAEEEAVRMQAPTPPVVQVWLFLLYQNQHQQLRLVKIFKINSSIFPSPNRN